MSKLTDELEAMGFRTTRDLVRLGEVKSYIAYNTEHPHALGWKDYWVKVYFLFDDGRVTYKEIRHVRGGSTAKANRDAHLNVAIEYYDKRKDTVPVEWVRSPFTDEGWYWIPKQTYDHVMELVKAWRKEQRAQAKKSASESA